MKYLKFYLDRKCVVVPGWGKTKNTRGGCTGWTAQHTKWNVSKLRRNAKLVNGTGGLLVVDIDPKNGGSVELLRQRFPDLPDTRTVSTVTPHPEGPGVHLIFSIPTDVKVATNRGLGTGIDVPHSVMLPGSVVELGDGTEGRYELIAAIEPAPAPMALIAAVARAHREVVDEKPGHVAEVDDDGLVAHLVEQFADAGDGERNEVYTKVAPVVIGLRGEEGADMLRLAYTGDDHDWLEAALSSTLGKYDGVRPDRTVAKPSRYVVDALRAAEVDARLGNWPGRAGASDRKVMLAIIDLCTTRGSMSAPASVRTLALATGLETKTAGKSVARLVESGRLFVVKTADDGTPEYAPRVGEMTTDLSKGIPIGIPSLSEVWLSDGLGGRCSQVFDLVSAGVRRATPLVKAGGMGIDAARDALAALVEAGLVIRDGLDHAIVPDAVEVADQLAKERGGLLRWIYLEERIRDERARPRGDEVAAAKAADDERRRREEDEELMRQVGVL
ncbi:bifunctional DNA primase/polymerase [Mycolicibacterium neoaurum]|uniref:bifunctional DNA primase/polymerase n=1 Tax=Mycolicibacterium neoaurum TaxID=1795 RepID=UPI001BD00DDB|nr:bifunctional DNA primase/polymerase [Mycolicibacterium neoaurum]QVI29629.1 bifunctional DNA primase/polymerase [Mycolicibacterium neoaurum]